MKNYSIIIPHKNCQELLIRCLKSIPNRDDIEVIVVDDNSNIRDFEDSIKSNCHLTGLKIYCLKETKFAGGARNCGLRHASGKWLVFADSDDFFTDDAFDIMDEYLDTNADIVYFAHKAVFSDDLQPTQRLGERIKYINEYLEAHTIKSENYLKFLNHSPTSKIIRRELACKHNLWFDEVPASNDAYFSVTTGFYAKSILADKRAVYVATVRRGSITQTKNKVNDFSRYRTDVKLYNFYREHGLKDMYPFVTMWVINSLRHYGFKEFFKYLKLARENRINIFLGISRRFRKRYKY